MRDRAEHLRQQDEEKAPAQKVESTPESPVARLQDLQRGMGNAAVVGLLGAQPKMQVGGVHDPAEAEADRVAAQVLRHLDSPAAAPTADPAQQRGGLARLVRRKAAPAAASAPGHGPAGGDVLPETAGAIDAARGGGKPMDDATLSRMEGAFGTDLGDVRIHTDGQSASLNRDLNARAFTTGKDIFFGAGEYDPGSRGGQEVLAHELTHTLQQGGDPQRLMRKLSLDNTNWDQAGKVKIAEGGATGGVALFMGELAVKVGESFGPELVLAANLHNAVEEDQVEDDGWSAGSPRARLAEGAEVTEIKNVVQERLASENRELDDRESDWFEKAGQGWTVVFDWATGQDFNKVVAESKATKKKGIFSKKRKLREDSGVAQVLSEPGHLRAFGRATAVDIFMGNGDRIHQLNNPENWKVDVDNKKIVMMDNVQMWDASQFATDLNDDKYNGLRGLTAWSGLPWLKNFAAGTYTPIATKAVQNLGEALMGDDRLGKLRDEDRALVQETYAANEATMIAAFEAGLEAGKQGLMTAIKRPEALAAGMKGDTKKQVVTSITARRFLLMGEGPEGAWKLATDVVDQTYGTEGPKTRKRR